jgi:hypothetical protein
VERGDGGPPDLRDLFALEVEEGNLNKAGERQDAHSLFTGEMGDYHAAGPSLGSPPRMAGSPSRRCYWRLFS